MNSLPGNLKDLESIPTLSHLVSTSLDEKKKDFCCRNFIEGSDHILQQKYCCVTTASAMFVP
jgi:hypothetical protein